MRIAGIICEFNPFHNGHKYLIDNVRQALKPDAVICVMSGNFTQRGEPAIINKYERARSAVLSGADLVIELPVCCAVNSAYEFAKGGISILNKLPGTNYVAFGSECGDISILQKASSAAITEDNRFTEYLKENLNKGFSYPKAYHEAMKYLLPEIDKDLFSGPNNILGIEYMKQIKLQNSSLMPYTIKRYAADHDSLGVNDSYSSAKCIREILLSDNKSAGYKQLMPHFSAEIISQTSLWNECCDDRLFSLVRSSILSNSSDDLSNIYEISEGLENRLKSAVINSDSMEALIQTIKSKRYTYSKVSRILIQLILGLTKEKYTKYDIETNVKLRSLAFNDVGRNFIKVCSENGLTIYTNLKKQLTDEEINNSHLALDIYANDLYSILTGKSIYNNSDCVCNSIYCKL